jgi:arabinofuranosyltransferase
MMSPEVRRERERTLYTVGAACLLTSYAVLLLRGAWVSDDGFITLRTVANFVDGYGLRWNLDERVQAFTHPLWMFCLSGLFAIVRDPFYSAVLLSVGVSLAAMGVLWSVAADPLRAAALGALLLLSKSFLDYSTSGLENPLTHLLLGVFVWLALRRPERLDLHVGTAALLATNRLDAVLLALPWLGLSTWSAVRRAGLWVAIKSLAIGALPLGAWLGFSLFYFGFAFPNTAYAKLNLGIPSAAIAKQGVVYLLNTVSWDPWLALALLGTTALALAARDRLAGSLAVGAILYVLYVVRVGGDFMAGRFLTAPLFASTLACVSLPGFRVQARELAMTLFPLGTLFFATAATERWPAVNDFNVSGVADERIYYRDCMSLMVWNRTGPVPCLGMQSRSQPLAAQGRVSITYNVGVAGYYVPREHHIIDPFALTDPLLARLPVTDPRVFRVGHYGRTVPDGYEATVRSGRCQLKSQALCAYWEKLHLVTSGPLWSMERLGAIAGFAFGRYQEHLHAYLREIDHPSLHLAEH